MTLNEAALKAFAYNHSLRLAYDLYCFGVIAVDQLVEREVSLRTELGVSEAKQKRTREWFVTREHCRSHDQLSGMTKDVMKGLRGLPRGFSEGETHSVCGHVSE